MSEPLRVGVVAEGPTDFIVIRTLAREMLGDLDFVAVRIQPPESDFSNSQGSLGGGWKAVLAWCDIQRNVEGGGYAQVMSNFSVLIIHLDAEVAREAELSEEHLDRPCPPARDAVNRIRRLLLSKLGLDEQPVGLVFCIPAQTTEAWVFACLHSEEVGSYQPFECRPNPASLLIAKNPHRLTRSKGNSVDKDVGRYKAAEQSIAAGWSKACTSLAEAVRFREEFLAARR